ncbi:co-chaperone protein HscB homolog [Sabethes cyaneus]|uniref:co-chaperone protein HscB homolog n=1 Tax=Sabethes cyaneus TaxID=53552 RepID=UPI00237E8794|nr:co-chaperone protein HscB homolog [Sabethes cyaneus]
MLRTLLKYKVSFIIKSAQGASRRTYCVTTGVCWSCNKSLVKDNKFFCAACGSLQKVKNQDFFELLDVPNTFTINGSILSANFRELQSVLHPDKFSQKSDEEKLNSLEWSSLVNKAFKTLTVPLERAKYILNQKGILIDEENTSVDPEFLSDMMDLNEQVEEAQNATELRKIADFVNSDIVKIYSQLQDHFANNNLSEAKATFVRLKYLSNIDNVIKEKALKYNLK